MSKPVQIVKIDESLLEYFKMVMDFQNESEEYREATLNEFKVKLTESLNCGPAIKEIVWVKNKCY